MSVFAMGDPHLAFGVPEKSMDYFGPTWAHYTDRIEQAWREKIKPEDLVLLPGDISWAIDETQVQPDLAWIESLPGTKVMLRGNHDYWWSSLTQVKRVSPPSLHPIHNSVYNWGEISIGGARLWDSAEYQFGAFIEYVDNPRAKKETAPPDPAEAERIFIRELNRLEISLQKLDPKAKVRIAMTHYPPISADLASSRASQLLEKYKIQICVFGHLHNVRKNALPFGEKGGVKYILTSADYLQFQPIQLL